MTTVEERLLPSAEPVRLIDQDGVQHDHPSYRLPTKEALVDGYTQLIKGRRINDQASALVRQGRLAVYPSSHGQEACQVAAAQVLADGDWLFPTYRDTVAAVTRGVPADEVLTLLKGDWHSGYDTTRHRVAPQSTPLATQLPHAVGVGHDTARRSLERAGFIQRNGGDGLIQFDQCDIRQDGVIAPRC